MDNLTNCMESVNNNLGLKETLSQVPSQNDSFIVLPGNISDETSIFQCSPNVPQETDIFSWLTCDTYYNASDSKMSNPNKCFSYVDYETASQSLCIDSRTYTRPKKKGMRNTLEIDSHHYTDISLQLNTHMPEFYNLKLLDSESLIECSLISSYTNELPISNSFVPQKFTEISDQENESYKMKTFNITNEIHQPGIVPSTSIGNNIIETSKHSREEIYTNITSSESECEPMSTNSDSSGTFIKSQIDTSNVKSDTFNKKSLKDKRQLTFDKDSPPNSLDQDITLPNIISQDLQKVTSPLNETFELKENVNCHNETFDFSQKFDIHYSNEHLNNQDANATFNKDELESGIINNDQVNIKIGNGVIQEDLDLTFTSDADQRLDTINVFPKAFDQSTPATRKINKDLQFQRSFTSISPIINRADHDYISDHSDASSEDHPNSSKSSISPAGSGDLLAGGNTVIKTLPQLRLIPKNQYEIGNLARPLGLPKRGGCSGLRPPSINVARVNSVVGTSKCIPRLQRPSSSIPRPPLSRIPAPRGRSNLPTGISQFNKRS